MVRKLLAIVATVAIFACVALYVILFENVRMAKDMPLRPGNLAAPGIEAYSTEEQTEKSVQAGTLHLTPEVLHAFQDATAGTEGIVYTPEAFLGSRIVADNAGTDYLFLCFVQEAEVHPYYAVLTIFEYPDGEARIVTIEKQATHSSSEVMAYSSEKSIDDYDMADILLSPDLTEQYKQAHPYLDDMVHFPVENARIVQEIGYSRIWKAMEVRIVGEAGGEHVVLYENISREQFENFRDSDDPDRYWKEKLARF